MDSVAGYIDNLKSLLKHPCNVMLWRLLKSYDTQELVLHGGSPFIEFRGQNPKDILWLPVRPLVASESWFSCTDDLLEFYTVLGGLREQPPAQAGSFFTMAETTNMQDLFGFDSPEFKAHAHLPVIFESAGGDAVVKSPTHEFIWFVLEEHSFKPMADSFASFMRAYVKYRLAHDGWPFDPYGRSS